MSDAPSVDELFDMLSHSRRRAILLVVALAPADGVRLRTIAETIYGVEHDITPTRAPSREVTNLRSNLTRSHLDRLEAGGLITVGPRDRLAAGPAFGRAMRVIALAHAEVSWDA